MNLTDYAPHSLNLPSAYGLRSCVDDYFCTSEATAPLRHALLGPLSLILLLFSLFTNILIVSVLGNRHLSSAANAYLTTAILSDAMHCVVYIVGIVMPSMTFNPKSQTGLYITIVAYLVPIGEPFGHMLSLLTALCLICAAVIRIKSHLKHQKMIKRSEHHLRHHHTVASNTRRLHLLTAVTSIFIICAPTFVRYKVVETLIEGKVHVRVEYTALFKQENNWSMIWNLYDTVLLALATIVLIILVAALSVAVCKQKVSFNPRKLGSQLREHMKMSSSTLSEAPIHLNESAFFKTQDEFSILSQGHSVVKRIKMEIRILCMYTFLWIFPASAYMLFKVILVTSDKTRRTNTMNDQIIKIGIISQFAQILFLFVRTLACLFGGVYIRRILKNMFCVCLRPKDYHHVMSYGDMALLQKLNSQQNEAGKSNSFSRKISSYSMRLPLIGNGSVRDSKSIVRGPSMNNLQNMSIIEELDVTKSLTGQKEEH